MTLQYFKSQICEELKGARDYMKMAVQKEATNPGWAAKFYDMSVMELSHASTLFKMAEEYYASLDEKEQKSHLAIYNCIVNVYTEDTAKVKYMQQLFNQAPQTTVMKPVTVG